MSFHALLCGAAALASLAAPVAGAQVALPQTMSPIVVTANPLRGELFDMIPLVSVLVGEALLIRISPRVAASD